MTLSRPTQPTPVAAGQDVTQRRLLQSIAEVARSVFAAAAASVFLIDPGDGNLVFEAVSGEGEQRLVGARLPGDTGIAGWVARYGQPMLVDDLDGNPQFARPTAESTGYVPRSILAAPLIRDGEPIGVLEVLDRSARPRGDLGDVELLSLLATEMSVALELLVRLRRSGWTGADPAQPASPGEPATIQRIADRLPWAGASVADAVRGLLAAADGLLAGEAAGHYA
jgi:signal transduction protein with GAF and PtsI domain